VTLSAASSCETVAPPRPELAITRVFWLVDTPTDLAPRRTITLAALVDLDVASERRAREELAPLCSGAGDHQRIVLSIGERCFVDVRGVAVLVEAARAARRRDRELVIVAGPGSLRICVDALGLDTELRIAGSIAEVV
jgi:anti-anti-sigma factor